MTSKCVLSVSSNNRRQGFNVYTCMPHMAADYSEMLCELIAKQCVFLTA